MSRYSSPSGGSISGSWPEIKKRPAELVDDDLENRPLVEVYDTLLIPALALAETDWHRGELDEARHKFILQSLKEMIHERGEDQQEMPAKEGEAKEAIAGSEDGKRPHILCLPARDEADEIAGLMLAQLLATGDCLVQSVSFTATADELVDLVERRKPDVVCISATPPAAVMHARHLCKHVRGRFPQVPMVVGLWDAQGDLEKAQLRIGGGAATQVVATLAEALAQVRLLSQPLLPTIAKQPRLDSNPISVQAGQVS